MEIRLNKYISDSGFCSRREADKFIEKGKVIINGKIAKVGSKVSSKDQIKVNGNLIECRDEYVYLALNKPVGITCTTDTTDDTNIVDFVNYPTRIFNVGRLDKDSEGLILLTDDGDIVNKILRSGNSHEKEYEVTVDKPITDEFIKRMSSGVAILGITTRKCKVVKEGDKNFRIILTQGLDRQIRRMCEEIGYNVVKLRRVRIMHIKIDNIPLEQWRALTDSELGILKKRLYKSENDKVKKEASTEKKASGSGKPKTGIKTGIKTGAKTGMSTGEKTGTKGGLKKASSFSKTTSKFSGQRDERGGRPSSRNVNNSKLGGAKRATGGQKRGK